MTLPEIAEKIKNLNGNKIYWSNLLTDDDETVAVNAHKKIDIINHDIKNLKQLSFDMVVYPENYTDYPETQHPSMQDIID